MVKNYTQVALQKPADVTYALMAFGSFAFMLNNPRELLKVTN